MVFARDRIHAFASSISGVTQEIVLVSMLISKAHRYCELVYFNIVYFVVFVCPIPGI